MDILKFPTGKNIALIAPNMHEICMKNQNWFLGLSPLPNQFNHFEKPKC